MNLELAGRKVIIGGATKGIGNAVVELLASEGCDIALFGRDSNKVESATASLRRHGVTVFGETFNLQDREDYRTKLKEMADKLGGCDIFIHNISSSGSQATMDWQQSFNVDILGAVDGCETLEPFLVKSPGSVILMSSTAAVETFLAPQAFNAVKAGLITYGKQLSQAWAAKGIRVNMVSPGPIKYPGGNWEWIEREMPDLYNATLEASPFGRFGTPNEIAKVVAFLASPAASWVTGINLVADGGFTKRVQF